MNLPKTFEPIAYTGVAENAARAAGWTVRHLLPMESGPRPWFQRAAPSGERTNRDEIDLNRDYRNSRSLETKSHIETLLTLGRFEASMMLHEDYEGIGAYLYELNDTLDPGLGAKIIAAMGLHVPVDLRPEIDEAVARGGVISRRDLISKLGRLEDRPEWSEATYLTVYHTEVSYTIETPKPFPIKARVKAHIAAVETLMNALKGKTNPLCR